MRGIIRRFPAHFTRRFPADFVARSLACLRAGLRGNPEADRVVPPAGFTVWLTVFSAAAMAFLAVFALAFAVSAARLADHWTDELERTSTLRLPAVSEASLAQERAQVALALLAQTPGVAASHVITAQEQQSLLAPWFGDDVPVDLLALPTLIEIEASAQGYDAPGLRLRLEAELPGAVLDDHRGWQRPLRRSAARMRGLALFGLVLIAAVMVAMIALAAHASLAASAQVVEVLRLVGASDSYIAGAFTRRFTRRSLVGAAFGVGAAVLLLVLLGGGATTASGALFPALGFRGASWLWALVVVPVAGGLAYGATTFAARQVLRRMG